MENFLANLSTEKVEKIYSTFRSINMYLDVSIKYATQGSLKKYIATMYVSSFAIGVQAQYISGHETFLKVN